MSRFIDRAHESLTFASSQNEESDFAAERRYSSYRAQLPPNCRGHDQSPDRMRRAEGCQCSSDYERLDMTAVNLTERKSVPKRESAPSVGAAIAADRPVSKNN